MSDFRSNLPCLQLQCTPPDFPVHIKYSSNPAWIIPFSLLHAVRKLHHAGQLLRPTRMAGSALYRSFKSTPARIAASSNHPFTRSRRVGYGFTFSARSVSIQRAGYLPTVSLGVPTIFACVSAKESHCGAHDVVVRVREVGSCRWVVTFRTSWR